ncbi:MAG: hypothetical protein ABI443_10130 [Chthoniobacterales bacterium]
MSRYLDAAKAAVQTLLEKQSVHWGGNPDGPLCITASQVSCKAFRTIGGRSNSKQISFPFPKPAMEDQPYRLDISFWPVMTLLSEVSGDPVYQQYVHDMAKAFVPVGFEPLSGLGYFGEMADFDAIRLEPLSVYPGEACFKPTDDIPLGILWNAAPEAMARMFRSMFYGLIQRPETMEYNRFCEYDYDDSAKKPCRIFRSNHCATAYAGAYMMQWWGFYFAHSGDTECIGWAQAIANKWQKVQHPVSGLVPCWFGDDLLDGDVMPPRPFTNNWDGKSAVWFLRAADEWKKMPEGQTLAAQLEDMALKLITGMAKYGYDAESRTFPQWINVDGSAIRHTTWYTYYSKGERDKAAEKDPLLNEVDVFAGSGFYQSIRPWILEGGNPLPYNITYCAKRTGDPYLIDRAREFAVIIMEESRKLTGEFNGEDQWSYPANASYIKMMILLFEMTAESRYLDWACELADLELKQLTRPLPPETPEWWRMYFRGAWIESLMLLHRAITQSEIRLPAGKSDFAVAT